MPYDPQLLEVAARELENAFVTRVSPDVYAVETKVVAMDGGDPWRPDAPNYDEQTDPRLSPGIAIRWRFYSDQHRASLAALPLDPPEDLIEWARQAGVDLARVNRGYARP